MQRINITLPKDVLKKLRAAIPQGKRSNFITQALNSKLKANANLKEDLKKSFKAQERIIAQIQEDYKYVDQEEFEKLP